MPPDVRSKLAGERKIWTGQIPPISVDAEERTTTTVNGRPSITFLDLPHIVRDRIYQLNLVVDKVITHSVEGLVRKYPDSTEKVRPSLAIFRTCRKVFEEAVSIYYERNIFVISSLMQLMIEGFETLPGIQANLRLIKSVEVCFDMHEYEHHREISTQHLELKMRATLEKLQVADEAQKATLDQDFKKHRDALHWLTGSDAERETQEGREKIHLRQSFNIVKYYVHGLIFVRDSLDVRYLALDFDKDFFCKNKCCELPANIFKAAFGQGKDYMGEPKKPFRTLPVVIHTYGLFKREHQLLVELIGEGEECIGEEERPRREFKHRHVTTTVRP
ncbi:hypothetical protein MMC13_003486 [Lambiella insularis]|nr:hypothetical protein [Lambiella insularis]